MLFPTVEYALFFLVVLAAAWATHRRLALHKALLLVASYVFYGYWHWRFLPLLAGISLEAWVVARCLQRATSPRARQGLLAAGVGVSLAVLGFFKYLVFATNVLASALSLGGIAWAPALPDIALPIGVSFFVFHAISLMMDTYRGKLQDRVTLVDALLYIAFFPQLVAGPILRAASFLPQLRERRDPRAIDASRAVLLIVVGLGKKVVLASALATTLVDAVFETPARRSGLEVLAAVYGYAAQIYCDFSGYTDIAIGSALLLGYQFPENFDAPYTATDPQDFWRRWHISLSSWLRDYLYVPLGGSRSGPGRTYVNLMLTMLLGGLWHGAAWHFVIWGGLHGGALCAHRFWSRSASPVVARIRASGAWALASRILLFHFVCFGWVFFRAPSWSLAIDVLRALANPWRAGPWLTGGVVAALVLGLLGQAIPPGWMDALRDRLSRWPVALQGALCAVAVLLIDAFGPVGIPPFIYFRF